MDSQQSFDELTRIHSYVTSLRAPPGPHFPPPAWIDLDDVNFGFNELVNYIVEFSANAGGIDVPFWTEVLAMNPSRWDQEESFDFNESRDLIPCLTSGMSEITCRVDLIPREGDGVVSKGNIVSGYGFDNETFGSAILFEVTLRPFRWGQQL